MVYYRIQQRNNYSVAKANAVNNAVHKYILYQKIIITLNVLVNVIMLQKASMVNINVLNHVQKTTSMNK